MRKIATASLLCGLFSMNVGCCYVCLCNDNTLTNITGVGPDASLACQTNCLTHQGVKSLTASGLGGCRAAAGKAAAVSLKPIPDSNFSNAASN